jgi:hypothetical protein
VVSVSTTTVPGENGSGNAGIASMRCIAAIVAGSGGQMQAETPVSRVAAPSLKRYNMPTIVAVPQ